MLNWNLNKHSLRPIGLDIGHSFIKMLQLSINGGGVSVLAAEKVPIDPAVSGDREQRRKFIISKLRHVLAQNKFVGRNVVSCLPNDQLWVTSLRLSDAAGGDIEEVVQKEAEHRFGLNPGENTIEYVVAGDVQHGEETKKELVLFAAENESIKEHIEMIEESQLRLVGLDAIPCALFRCFERSLRRQEDRERTVVFVDVGSQFSTVVFGRDGEVTFVKQIAIGGEKFNREIATKLGVTTQEAELLRSQLRREKPALPIAIDIEADKHTQSSGYEQEIDAATRQVIVDSVGLIAEELAREVSLCLRYYTVTFRGKRIERVVFSGGEAYENILLNVLRRELTVDVEVAQPLKGFDMRDVEFDDDRRGLLCEWSVAVGLSLKGWDGEFKRQRGRWIESLMLLRR